MADAPISRPKREGNYYIPPHILAIQIEVAARYAKNESARSLAKEYGISKLGVRGCVERTGGLWRDRQAAGRLARRTDSDLTPEEISDTRSIAQQVAEKYGYGSSKGLSFDREFRTLCAEERRRRNPDKYRDIDNRRNLFLNRIPGRVKRSDLEVIYQAAKAGKLHIDHDVPLDNDLVCGLKVPRNLRMVTPEYNWSKSNKFECGPDYTMPPYVSLESIAREGGGPTEGPQLRTPGRFECLWEILVANDAL
jgi:hypothetical protein